MTTRVAIVDDHPMVAEGIQAILESYGTIEVVGTFSSGQAILDAAEALAPGKIRALDHAPSLYVDMPGFVRGLGRMALRGDSHVRRPH